MEANLALRIAFGLPFGNQFATQYKVRGVDPRMVYIITRAPAPTRK